MIKHLFIAILTIISFSFDVLGNEEVEFYKQDEGEFTRVGFSYVIGAPNPLTAPTEYPNKGCPITYVPQKTTDWVKTDVNEMSLDGVVARYGYGWIFLDIPNQKGLGNSMLKHAIPGLIQENNKEFCSLFSPICSGLYETARNKVTSLFNFYYTNGNARVDAIVSKEDMEDFVGSLFYAYGGRLDIKGESYLYLPLCKASITDSEAAIYGEKPISFQILNAGVVGYEGCRIFNGSLGEGRYGTHGKNVLGRFHIEGLKTAL